MLRYFRINDPYRLIGLLGLLVALCLPLLMDTPQTTLPELKSFLVGEKVSDGFGLYHELIDSTPPFAAWFYGACDFLFGRSLTARHIAALLILFFQSAFLGIVFIDKKVFAENTYIPTLIFSILTLISFDFLSLTADLLAFGFLLLALNALLTEIEFRVQRDETIFNLGLFISFASLCNFSYIIFLPGIILILLLFTRNTLRKHLLLLTGFLLPHLILCSVYYINGNLGDLWNRFYWFGLSFPNEKLVSLKSLLILTSVPLVYLFISVFILGRDARLTKYQSQLLQTMFLWLLIGLLQIYFTPDLRPQNLLPLLPAVSFFLTHFLLLIRRRKFAELSIWMLLIGVVCGQYLTRYNKLTSVDYASLFVNASSFTITDKNVLLLADQPGIFLNNKLSPPFINWPLTKEIMDGPQYYENLLLVSRLFEKDLPEVIVDPENKMEKFFERLPVLKIRYSKSLQGYWQLIPAQPNN
ncbi:MAG: hypothetical protein KF725_01035 [Cyclobacteriaceae bacterium]|nr:hypothetical protein [Cyclobacteriaceae bacterium]UYN86960.1 MAG: hypothetical protein KIT51_01370 [Cyclobacteriaceae bacterium]